MATRTGQKIQNQWTEDEVEDLLVLMDILGGSLPMKKLEALQDKEQPKEAYPPFKRLIEGQGNGGLQSKAKKLALALSEKRRRGRRRSRRRGRRRRGRSRSRGGRRRALTGPWPLPRLT